MKGYIRNRTHNWIHATKRAIGPGAKISLSTLYDQYGKKYGISEGEPFVDWLRTIKFKDREKWEITLIDEAVNASEKVEPEEEEVIDTAYVAPMVAKKMEVGDVVEMSVRKARDILPKITDLTLLKYALQEANPRAGKDSLCIVIRKRIKELQLAR
jgi:hypothetical protein